MTMTGFASGYCARPAQSDWLATSLRGVTPVAGAVRPEFPRRWRCPGAARQRSPSPPLAVKSSGRPAANTDPSLDDHHPGHSAGREVAGPLCGPGVAGRNYVTAVREGAENRGLNGYRTSTA